MSVKDRIKEFCKVEKLSVTAFETSIGVSNGYVNSISKSIGIEKLNTIIENYSNLNIEWLLTGKGPMLKSAEPIDTYKPLSGPTPPAVEVKPIHKPRSIEKKVEEQVVYLYDFEATAGLKALFDNNRQNIIDTIKIPNLPKCDGAIHIVGDSMYPILKSGDIILYKQMPPGIENLLYGEMYLLSYDINGEDYIVVKYIRKSDKGEPFVTLASENPEHAARDIDFRRVTALALVKASVRINCMM